MVERGYYFTTNVALVPANLESMNLKDEDRRTFVALACLVAWTDGVVTDEERAHVLRLAERVAGAVVARDELEEWLTKGPPEAEISRLPPSLGEYFFYEAMQLVQADGDIDDRELTLVQDLMQRVFADAPQGTPLARIALVKKPAQ